MNILLLLTGGTICSFENEVGERVSDTRKAQTLIVKNFKNSDSKYRNNVKFTTKRTLNILSENMTVSHWNIFIKKFKSYDLSLYDGVIILHGTDTLAYTSSLLSILLAGTKIPVMLVSSAKPIYIKDANGNNNFKTAVELICKGVSPNVYAIYQNTDGTTYIHLASRLLQCQNGSSDFFSRGMMPADRTEFKTSEFKEMPIYSLDKLLPTVLYITPYTGIDYSLYSLRGVKAVLHGTYHSCTAAAFPKNSRYSLISFKKRCDRYNIPLFLCPCDSDAYDYETTGELLRHGAVGICDMTTETAYAKILIGVSMGLSGDALNNYVNTEINGEFAKNS